MDVSDLKGLVRAKSRSGWTARSSTCSGELGGVRTGRASVTILDTVHVEAYGSHMPLNQVASLSIPEPHVDRRAAVRSVADGDDREGDPHGQPRAESDQRRQGRPHPAPALTEERRKELSKLVHKYAEEGRNGVRQVRRDANDTPEEAAQGSQDLRRRRAARPRRRAEDHRSAHRHASTSCRRRKTGSCWKVTIAAVDVLSSLISWNARVLRAAPARLRSSRSRAASLHLRRSPARPIRPRRGARRGSASPSRAASPTCGATAS